MNDTEYHKIYGPFHRHVDGPNKHKFRIGDWFRPEFNLLQHAHWTWTEKINGTNGRVIWDGHKVRFGGRTDNAGLRVRTLEWLGAEFPEELLEQQFGSDCAVLYGEMCGSDTGVNGSGVYGRDHKFVIFDVKVGNWWLLPETVRTVAQQMGKEVACDMYTGPIWGAIDQVAAGLNSVWGDFKAEGLVGRPPLGVTARDGDRLLIKVKSKDFTSPVPEYTYGAPDYIKRGPADTGQVST